jgi:glycosyltransferase involved in cell wall biosynthesis
MVLTLSESGRYRYLIRRLAKEENLLATVNPIDLEAVPSPEDAIETRKKEGWGSEFCHVVSVGRLADQKRVDWLLRSWEIVIRSVPTARLWIVGDGKERVDLERLAKRLNLGETCVFLGSRENGVEYVAAADIVAMTSLYESQGRVSLEAMACGKPIVASRVDGICDSLKNGVEGFLVAPGDIKKFAECILVLLRSPELRVRMGEAGRMSVKKFDIEHVLDHYACLYHQLLAD